MTVMQFNKTICVSNIYTLAKKKSLKICEVEDKSGVSPGYLSRLSKEGCKTIPGIDFLMSVSQVLNVSLEGLLTCDYSSLTDDENKTINFLTKLIKDSNESLLVWKNESFDDRNSIILDENGYRATHPLMEYFPDEDNPCIETRFCSKFHIDTSSWITECFSTVINNSAQLFLLYVNYISSEKKSGYELYMLTNNKLLPICYALDNSDSYNTQLLISLMSSAKSSSSRTHLDEEAKFEIDLYLDPSQFDDVVF